MEAAHLYRLIWLIGPTEGHEQLRTTRHNVQCTCMHKSETIVVDNVVVRAINVPSNVDELPEA